MLCLFEGLGKLEKSGGGMGRLFELGKFARTVGWCLIRVIWMRLDCSCSLLEASEPLVFQIRFSNCPTSSKEKFPILYLRQKRYEASNTQKIPNIIDSICYSIFPLELYSRN